MNKPTETWKKIWARKYSPFLGSVYNRVFSRPNQFAVCKHKLFLPEGKLHGSYFREDEWDRLVQRYFAFLRKQNIPRYARQYEKIFTDSVKWARQFIRTDFSRLTNRELAKSLQALLDFYYPYGDAQYLAFVVLEGPGRNLEAELSRYPNKAEILRWVTTPYKITLIVKAHLELLRLIKSKQTDKKMLLNFSTRYAWLAKYDNVDRDYTLRDVQKEIKSIKNPAQELHAYYAERRKSLKQYRVFLRSIKYRSFKKLVELVHYFSYLKEMRDDYRRQVVHILLPFWEEVGKRLRISYRDTSFYLGEELIALLQYGRRADKRLIVARKRAFSLVIDNNKTKIVAKDLSPEYLIHSKADNQREVHGQPAYQGKIHGRVNIVLHRDEFKKFKKGDILVTVMTHPEFLPIMKSARAIVTDEGGITCHAAIVSRELKVPCIIGTRVATQVFKDGDIVELDANEGVVRKVLY